MPIIVLFIVYSSVKSNIILQDTDFLSLSGNDARNGENPHEYRLFCPSILLLILD